MRKRKTGLNFEKARAVLKVHHTSTKTKLTTKHKIAADFWKRHNLDPGKIRSQAKKLLATGALAGSVLLSTRIGLPVGATTLNPDKNVRTAPGEIRRVLQNKITGFLPFEIENKLSTVEEQEISQAIFDAYGIKASAELDGNRLNHSYGRMGAEQHLPRFPGDSVFDHKNLIEKGITPGKGAWGYFANNKEELTLELEQTEKYYVAVQTLYLPNWKSDLAKLRDWYKYRHMIVINPANGKTMVVAIADAGPADWTGKQFGGSPEVMEYLGIDYGRQNHPVVLFFLDDSDNKIPLGPLETKIN